MKRTHASPDGGRVRDRRRSGAPIENRIERAVTRRRLLATGAAGGVILVAGCRSGAQPATGWAFVDDRKRTVRLKKLPTRIVAYSTAAAALYDWGVTPVGVFGDSPRDDPLLAGLPWDRVQVVGSVCLFVGFLSLAVEHVSAASAPGEKPAQNRDDSVTDSVPARP